MSFLYFIYNTFTYKAKENKKEYPKIFSLTIGYSISFGVKIFGVNFRVNLGVDFWGLLNDLFFFSFSFLYTLCVVFFLIIFRRFIQS